MDRELLFLINTGFHSVYLDRIFVLLSEKGYLLFVPFLVYTSLKTKDRQGIINLLAVFFLAFALSDWLATELKGLFSRPRPCNVESGLRDFYGCSTSFSMPSNHATNSASAACVLVIYSLRSGVVRPIMIFPVVIALLISVSRVYLGVHYPSDVLLGILLGVVIGLTVSLSVDRLRIYYRQRPIETMLFLINVLLFLFRLYYIRHGGLDISPDEAHYWEWSRRLDLSYYSKGPLIAYLIKMGTSILGDTNTGVRIFAPLLLAISSLFMYALTYKVISEIKSEQHRQDDYIARLSGLISAITLHVTPLFSVYGIVFTIDAPFLFLWIIALYQFIKVTEDVMNYGKWLVLGVIVGLGLLAKYTMLFFIFCVAIYLLFSDRRIFLTKGPYIGLLATLLFFLPVLIFNYRHDWVTVRHTLGQANVQEGMVLVSRYFFEFLGSQFAVLSGIFAVLMVYSIFKIRRYVDRKYMLYILCLSLPVFVFFLLKSLQGKVQPNWAMPAYIVTIIPMAYIVSMSKVGIVDKRIFSLFKIGVAVSLIISVVGLYPHFFGLTTKLDPSARLRGWTMLAQEVDKIRADLPKDNRWLIFSDAYQISSELAFYLKDKPVVYCINLNRRMNQYDLWESPNTVLEKIKADKGVVNAIYVTVAHTDTKTGEIFDATPEIAHRCERSQHHIVTVRHKNRFLRNYAVLICYNLGSLPKSDFKTF
ncbi:MAG: glycosyltransferase family 39 protein [Thermodesulfovibrionales bacterium]